MEATEPLDTIVDGVEAVVLEDIQSAETATTVDMAASVDTIAALPLATAASDGSSKDLSVKPLNISDLPSEILCKIMSHLSRPADQYGSNGLTVAFSLTPKDDLKNARLSCHVLSAAASRYLIECVTVDVSLSSLSRLEAISNHALLRPGVQIVKFCLVQYDPFFAGGVQGLLRFIHYAHFRLSSIKTLKSKDISRCWSAFAEGLLSVSEDMTGSFDEDLVFIEEIKNATDTGYNGPLLEAYCLYRSRLHEQTSLQNDGTFFGRVSAAMRKLPLAKDLKISDSDTMAWNPLPGRPGVATYKLNISSNDSIIKDLAGRRDTFEDIHGTTLLSMVPGLICAAGEIKSLDIRITPAVPSYATLSFSTLQEAELRSNLKNLQSFSFDNYRSSTANPWNEAPAVRSLGRFLDACLVGSEKLEHLFVHAKIRHPNASGSLLSPRAWPALNSVHLEALPASAADLDALTASLASQQPRGSLALRDLNLYCGGTWAAVLDMLRERRIPASLSVYQRGAEFETDPALCETVFRDSDTLYNFHASFAEHYVLGFDMENPLRSPPDQDLWDSLFGPPDDIDADGQGGY